MKLKCFRFVIVQYVYKIFSFSHDTPFYLKNCYFNDAASSVERDVHVSCWIRLCVCRFSTKRFTRRRLAISASVWNSSSRILRLRRKRSTRVLNRQLFILYVDFYWQCSSQLGKGTDSIFCFCSRANCRPVAKSEKEHCYLKIEQ